MMFTEKCSHALSRNADASCSGSTLPEGQAFARGLLAPSGAAPQLLLLLPVDLLLLQNVEI